MNGPTNRQLEEIAFEARQSSNYIVYIAACNALNDVPLTKVQHETLLEFWRVRYALCVGTGFFKLPM